MPEPIYSTTTERMYSRLPEAVREQDRLQTPEYPFKKWISGIADQINELEVILSRIDYYPVDEGGVVGDTSDLVDPVTADDAWLPWLASLVGVTLTSDLPASQRTIISASASGFKAGTKSSVKAAAQTVLTGTKATTVYDHASNLNNRGVASLWELLVVTGKSETPDPAAVIAAIYKAVVKPVGVRINHTTYEASWATLMTTRSKWTNWNVTWRVLMDTGLSGTVATAPVSRVESLGYAGSTFGEEVY